MIEQVNNDSQVESVKQETQSLDNAGGRIEKDIKMQDTFSREYVESLRRENAKYRTESKQLRDDLQKTLIRSELKTSALSAGILDLDALKMFDTSKLSISAEGDVVGIDSLVSEMRSNKPYLFKQALDNLSENKKTEEKIEAKKQTSSATKAPVGASAKPRTAKDLSKEEFDRLVRNGFSDLKNLE